MCSSDSTTAVHLHDGMGTGIEEVKNDGRENFRRQRSANWRVPAASGSHTVNVHFQWLV